MLMIYIKKGNSDIYGYTDPNKNKKGIASLLSTRYFNIGLAIRISSFLNANYIYMNNNTVYYSYVSHGRFSKNETGLNL